MAKYGEIVALLEYMDRKKDKPVKGLFKKTKEAKPKSKIETLIEIQRELDEAKKFFADQEKINKKDEKKEDKKGWEALSPVQQAAYLTFAIQCSSLLWLAMFFKMMR